MAQRKQGRWLFSLLAVALIGGALTWAFWPRPTLVDIGTVMRGPMQVTIDEEGRTQVHSAYVVSTPIAGRLMRVPVEVGDEVIEDETIVARMRPTAPAALDIRTREQAEANIAAAQAALRVSKADVSKARADRDLAKASLTRTQTLFDRDIVSQAALDTAERAMRAADATLDTMQAAVSMRVAELNNAQANLLRFDDPQFSDALGNENEIPILAPTSGTILAVLQESEKTVAVGTPILEIGDIGADLEIEVNLLSTDAVQVRVGQNVIIDNWGGDHVLAGVVHKISPTGFTKVSALGVEEQRVEATIRFVGDTEDRNGLGHGFRVEARIVVWEQPQAVIVPSSSIYRTTSGWALFLVVDGIAQQVAVQVAANNGLQAAIEDGVQPDDQIILYPPSGLISGSAVAPRY